MFRNFFKNKDNHPNSLSSDERNALSSLSNDDSIVVTKPDKGNGVVILDRTEYVSKMLDIIGDESKFSHVTADDNLKNLKKSRSCLRYLRNKNCLNDDVYNRIYPTAASTPSMYGLPKTHKPDVPLRPILSSVGSFTVAF